MSVEFSTALCTSVVVFAFDGKNLLTLVGGKGAQPFQGAPMLTTNWVKSDESVEEVATEMVTKVLETKEVYLEQLNAFAGLYRNPMGRVVNIAYYCLVDWEEVKDVKLPNFKWVKRADVPDMIFDHNEILRIGYERLKRRVKHRPIGFVLLPKPFTFNMIHRLYQECLNKPLDKRNFRKKFMRSDLLIDTEESIIEAAGNKKPSRLYKFNEVKYQKLTLKGYDFTF